MPRSRVTVHGASIYWAARLTWCAVYRPAWWRVSLSRCRTSPTAASGYTGRSPTLTCGVCARWVLDA